MGELVHEGKSEFGSIFSKRSNHYILYGLFPRPQCNLFFTTKAQMEFGKTNKCNFIF